jgi:hypothetical protein
LEHELPQYPDITPDDLRGLGADMASRVARRANVAERLAAAGWSMHAECCWLVFCPPECLTPEQIEDRLHKLGISMRGLFIQNDEEEIKPGDQDSLWAANVE